MGQEADSSIRNGDNQQLHRTAHQPAITSLAGTLRAETNVPEPVHAVRAVGNTLHLVTSQSSGAIRLRGGRLNLQFRPLQGLNGSVITSAAFDEIIQHRAYAGVDGADIVMLHLLMPTGPRITVVGRAPWMQWCCLQPFALLNCGHLKGLPLHAACLCSPCPSDSSDAAVCQGCGLRVLPVQPPCSRSALRVQHLTVHVQVQQLQARLRCRLNTACLCPSAPVPQPCIICEGTCCS